MRAAAPLTAEELLHLNIPGKHTELVRGRLFVREPPGAYHGYVAMNVALAIGTYARRHGLGRVFAAETGFKLFSTPDTVRAGDAAFVRHDRLPDPLPTGYASIAPDLVVEVRSPSDRPGEVLAKVADWLSAGSALVWVVDPERRTAHIYRAAGSESMVNDTGSLDGEDVLSGFTCPLASLL